MPLVLAPRITGQLGNRLTARAHVLAACRELGWSCYDPFFGDYAGHFVHFRRSLLGPAVADDGEADGDPLARWRGPTAVAGQVVARGVRFLGPATFGLAQRLKCPAEGLDLVALAPHLAGVRVLSLHGYAFRSPTAVHRHRSWLAKLFQPIAAHRRPAVAVTSGLRARGDVLVGIHLRHGDYATHQGGRFFYPFATYRDLAERVAGLLAPRRAVFLACSNVPIPADAFPGLDWAPGPGHPVADLHALGSCDLLLGPPSSFSTWAAFIGGGRLLRVEDPARRFTLEDFQPEAAPSPIW